MPILWNNVYNLWFLSIDTEKKQPRSFVPLFPPVSICLRAKAAGTSYGPARSGRPDLRRPISRSAYTCRVILIKMQTSPVIPQEMAGDAFRQYHPIFSIPLCRMNTAWIRGGLSPSQMGRSSEAGSGLKRRKQRTCLPP